VRRLRLVLFTLLVGVLVYLNIELDQTVSASVASPHGR
jgi:hypothetical protein